MHNAWRRHMGALAVNYCTVHGGDCCLCCCTGMVQGDQEAALTSPKLSVSAGCIPAKPVCGCAGSGCARTAIIVVEVSGAVS